MKEREPRVATAIPARIRLGDQWLDATIMNVSLHGMMLRMARPPGRGSYIEIRRASTIVVGRVIWAKDGKCGIRAQDRIDISALTGDAPAAPAWKAGDADRRAVQRRSIEESAAASQVWARRFQFAALIVAIVGGGFLILHSLTETFAAAMARVADAL
ncbi:PilZ domain-containing protein [Sphingobium amiense]|nr:PilZ domain-containing protein [Sphingobium amiense]